MELYPDIRVEVIGCDARLDLSRGEADIAVRAQQGSPIEPGIVFRRLAHVPWSEGMAYFVITPWLGEAGHGIGLLARPMAAGDRELVECFELPDLGRHFHLVVSEAVKDLPGVRAFNDFIGARAMHLFVRW